MHVNVEQAIELKELGFKERTQTYFENGAIKFFDVIGGWDFNSSFLTCFSRPSHSEVFDWFEGKHKLFSEITVDKTTYPKFGFEITPFFGNPKDLASEDWGWEETECSESLFKNRLEAESDCINQLISRVKCKQ